MNIADIFKMIISYLPMQDKVNVLSISKFHYNTIKLIFFDEPVVSNKIIKLPYFNNFTNIIVDKITNNMPNNVTHLKFAADFNKPIMKLTTETATKIASKVATKFTTNFSEFTINLQELT